MKFCRRDHTGGRFLFTRDGTAPAMVYCLVGKISDRVVEIGYPGYIR